VSALPVPESPPPAARRPLVRPVFLRVLLGLGLTLLLACVAAAGLWWYWTRKAVTPVDGTAQLPGLTAPVVVRRDALGIPHLEGSSSLDLMRAQGYVTAQDRLWQMDVMRRRALGELADAFGEGALRADQEIRTLGLNVASDEALGLLSPDLRAAVEAYADGVNAYITAHADALPIEFRLLRYGPRPWEARDTIAVGKLLALDLAKGWDSEAFRATVGDPLPPDVQEVLFPATFPHDRILVGRDGAAPPLPVASDGDTARGSNNWVISGAHTATGRPLLANDPHLTLGVPSIWAAVHLSGGGLNVAGVALPGTPGVILGRNDHVAWGCTNVEDDSADLYVEEVSPDGLSTRTPDGWAPVQVRQERILVREGTLSAARRTVDHPVRVTRHGPLIEIRARKYALGWTALRGAAELPAFALANRARGFEDFREAVRQFPGPSQNFVYADVDGHIAWYSAGRLPIRRGAGGERPYRGAAADGDWMGLVPFEELPHLVDPPSGRIVTANNRLVGADYPYRVTRGGIGPWRAAALFEALESRGGWTADDMVRLQAERLSIPHRDLARLLLETAGRHPGDAVWQDVAREMRGWDGRLEPGSRAAALAAVTFRAVGTRAIGPRVKTSRFAEALTRRSVAIHRLLLERPPSWVPPGDGDWDGVLKGAWSAAVADITARLGADRSAWTWGALNRMAVAHPLGRAIPPLNRLLSPPAVGVGGYSTTPNVLHITPAGSVEGPSMRFVADMADPDGTRLVNFMGQSGHPASPHYGDQLGLWVNVESPRLVMSPEAVAREARHTLRLVPK
jgi:penicillin G amidase